MMNYYRAYSMEYGTFVGLGWSGVFLSYVYGIRGDGMLLFLCMFFLGLSFVMPFVLGARLNRRMAADGAGMSYWQGLLFSFSMMMYACLLHGIVVYGYFELLDGGALVLMLKEFLGNDELRGVYQQMGMSEQYKQVMDMMDEIGGLGSLEKTMLIFNNDFMLSIALAFLVAIPVSWKRRVADNGQ